MTSLDNVLEKLGDFGKYQRRIYFLLCLPAISCALHKLSRVFLQAEMPHRCLLPTDGSNGTYPLGEDSMGRAYPWDELNKRWDRCSRYDINITREYLEVGPQPDPGTTTVPCQDWVFDFSMYDSTVVSEWRLVCSKAWITATSDSLLMVGVMLGSIIFGELSDRLGRRPIFFVSLVMQVVFGVLMGIAPDMYTYIIARMVVGATTSGVFLVAYVLAMEMVGPKKRMLAGVGTQMFFAAGFGVTAAFAYFIRDWRKLQIALTLPGVAFFCYWWLIPESVRWLLAKGHYDEAKEVIRKAAKVNDKPVPEETLDSLCADTETDKRLQNSVTGDKPSVFDLFKYNNLRRKTLIIFFLWFVTSGAYYGLSWDTSSLGGNHFVNFVMSGIVEIPAYILLMLTLDKYGRRTIQNLSLLAGGVTLIGTVFVPDGVTWLNIVLAMSGKLAISAAYGTVYIFSAEQFPTVVRNVGLGAASTSARFGGIAAPYINLLGQYWKPMPMLIFGVFSVIGGLMALSLPETLNKTLPDTIADGEDFGKAKKEVVTEEGPTADNIKETKLIS